MKAVKKPLETVEFQGVSSILANVRKQSGSRARGARDPDDFGRGRELFHCLHRGYAPEGAGPCLRPDGDESGLYASGDHDHRAVTEGIIGALIPPLPVAEEGGLSVEYRKAP